MAECWTHLSDAELRRRLIQRGCPTELAIAIVARRETDDADALVEEWLGT